MRLVIIAHNIRSTHNVGSILRTCDGFGVEHVYLTGYTPYPKLPADTRLPHVANKLDAQINKTALGAEKSVPLSVHETPTKVIAQLKDKGFRIVALEQTEDSISLSDYKAEGDIALVLGEEVKGIPTEVLEKCDETVEIPMRGQKESFNVSVATGIALYAFTTQSL
jgi:23S rRNA (guanosine2251-2'-O)-methyltransferase